MYVSLHTHWVTAHNVQMSRAASRLSENDEEVQFLMAEVWQSHNYTGSKVVCVVLEYYQGKMFSDCFIRVFSSISEF